MSESAGLDVQEAIIGALRADPTIQSLVGDRVWDQVKNAVPTFPYITYGGDDEMFPEVDPSDCADVVELFIQIDAWSTTFGQVEIKRIAGAVRLALNGAEFELDDHAMIVPVRHVITRYLPEPDGLTKHAAITLTTQVERPMST